MQVGFCYQRVGGIVQLTLKSTCGILIYYFKTQEHTSHFYNTTKFIIFTNIIFHICSYPKIACMTHVNK